MSLSSAYYSRERERERERGRERERERLIQIPILSVFMIGSKILRFMMSQFYVRVAKALVRLHAYLVSIFRLLKKKVAVVIIPVVIRTWEAI